MINESRFGLLRALMIPGSLALMALAATPAAAEPVNTGLQLTKTVARYTDEHGKEKVHYTIKLQNTTATPAAGVRLDEDLSGLLDDATVVHNPTAPHGALATTDTGFAWTGGIGPGKSVDIKFAVLPKADGGTYENTATVAWKGRTSAPCDSSYTVKSGTAPSGCMVWLDAPGTAGVHSSQLNQAAAPAAPAAPAPAAPAAPAPAAPAPAADPAPTAEVPDPREAEVELTCLPGAAGTAGRPDADCPVRPPHTGGGGAAEELAAAQAGDSPATTAIAATLAAASLATGAAVVVRRRRTRA
ncbi:hypothetical protein ACFQLX_05240 [Streptomyces polyrhachis]|uniref:DUF7927 domain-containing protein n=1 Tax=Streptomyces polyrhachis TaxID=1282885 RepID=A0ABW2GDW4_9ACTN